MKNIFSFLLMVALFGTALHAQPLPNTVTSARSQYNNLTDTVSGTGTKALKVFGPVKGLQTILTAVITVTPLSGVSNGNIICQASIDSLNWYNVSPITADSVYAIRLLSVPQSNRWKIANWRDQWVRFQVTGSVANTLSIISGKIFY